jgi:hypothetical protein
MTHRQILELASSLAEHGSALARGCRGLSVAALRGYLATVQSQCRRWSETLIHPALIEPPHGPIPTSWTELRPTLEELSTLGILLRISNTLLHTIGERRDIPFAKDVACRTARSHERVVQRAMAVITVSGEFPDELLVQVDRLGRMADRMSDLLCSATLAELKCDRFAVDPKRMADFAVTFARNPRLVRVPMQKALQSWPHTQRVFRGAEEVERVVRECFADLATVEVVARSAARNAPPLRVVRPSGSETVQSTRSSAASASPGAAPLAFPKHSFARSQTRLRDSSRG